MLYDARGREIWACPNVDSRAGEEAGELVRSGAAQEIYDRSGDWVSITAPARFRWIAKHEPDIFAAIAHVGMLGDWILTRLSGAFVTDRRSARVRACSSSPTATGQNTCSSYATSRGRSSRPSSSVEVSSARSPPRLPTQRGWPRARPSLQAVPTPSSACSGIGVTQPGRVTIVGGSFWQATVVLDEPLIDPRARLRTLCHTVPGRWMMEGIGFYCGIVMRWFRDAFCELESARVAARRARTSTRSWSGKRRLWPGSQRRLRLLLQPDAGEPVGARIARLPRLRCRKPVARGTYRVFPCDRGERGVCHPRPCRHRRRGRRRRGRRRRPHRRSREGDAVAADRGRRARAFRSGSRRSRSRPPLGPRSTRVSGRSFTTTPARLRVRLVRFERTCEPDAARATAYRSLYEQWLELYGRALELSETGLVRPLWRAAGT